MTLLITNDDGIESEGLATLSKVLGVDHEVWIIAPEKEKSGSSHAITLDEGIKITRRGERTFACGGTPVDCVTLGVSGVLPFQPEVVISGINHGPNVGTDIIYSGTAAAARQSALKDIPAVAVSLARFAPPWNFDGPAAFVAANLSLILRLWRPGHFVNINWPADPHPGAPPAITVPGRRQYKDELLRFEAPRGGTYYFLKGVEVISSQDEGTDTAAVDSGRISISAVALHPADAGEGNRYKEAAWRITP